MVSAGLYDCVLAVGVEKLYHEDKRKSFGAFSGAVDVEVIAEFMKLLQSDAESKGASSGSSGAGEKRSMFMDIYAMVARSHMERFATATSTSGPSSARS